MTDRSIDVVSFSKALLSTLQNEHMLALDSFEHKQKVLALIGAVYREHVLQAIDEAEKRCQCSSESLHARVDELRDQLAELSNRLTNDR